MQLDSYGVRKIDSKWRFYRCLTPTESRVKGRVNGLHSFKDNIYMESDVRGIFPDTLPWFTSDYYTESGVTGTLSHTLHWFTSDTSVEEKRIAPPLDSVGVLHRMRKCKYED
jgi:hypothetical protein